MHLKISSAKWQPFCPAGGGGVDKAADGSLVPKSQQAIIWNNDRLVYWRMYASLGLDDLNTETTTGLL